GVAAWADVCAGEVTWGRGPGAAPGLLPVRRAHCARRGRGRARMALGRAGRAAGDVARVVRAVSVARPGHRVTPGPAYGPAVCRTLADGPVKPWNDRRLGRIGLPRDADCPDRPSEGDVPLRQGHHLGRLARQRLAVRLHPGGPNPIMTLVAHSSRASGAGLSLPTGALSCPNVGLPAS